MLKIHFKMILAFFILFSQSIMVVANDAANETIKDHCTCKETKVSGENYWCLVEGDWQTTKCKTDPTGEHQDGVKKDKDGFWAWLEHVNDDSGEPPNPLKNQLIDNDYTHISINSNNEVIEKKDTVYFINRKGAGLFYGGVNDEINSTRADYQDVLETGLYLIDTGDNKFSANNTKRPVKLSQSKLHLGKKVIIHAKDDNVIQGKIKECRHEEVMLWCIDVELKEKMVVLIEHQGFFDKDNNLLGFVNKIERDFLESGSGKTRINYKVYVTSIFNPGKEKEALELYNGLLREDVTNRFGLTLKSESNVISSIFSGSPADSACLQEGDIIKSISRYNDRDFQKVQSIKDLKRFAQRLGNREKVVLKIRRNNTDMKQLLLLDSYYQVKQCSDSNSRRF
jgi:hypothetical protein